MRAPAPIGSNFRGFGVSEGLQAANAAAAPALQTAAGIQAQDLAFQAQAAERRKAAEFQQLLQKGVEGARAYTRDVAAINPTLGGQFSAELESVAPMFQALPPEEVAERTLSMYESWNNRLKEAQKPAEVKPYAPTTQAEALQFHEGKAKIDAQYRPKPKDKATERADKAKEALENIPRIWMGIDSRIKANAAAGMDLAADRDLATLISDLHKYETAAKMDLSEIDLSMPTTDSATGEPSPMAKILSKPSKSYLLYQNHKGTGTHLEPPPIQGSGGAQSPANPTPPGLSEQVKAFIAQGEALIAQDPASEKSKAIRAKIDAMKRAAQVGVVASGQ